MVGVERSSGDRFRSRLLQSSVESRRMLVGKFYRTGSALGLR